MTGNRIGFGLFLIFIGILIILVNMGVLDWGIVSALYRLWPLILVAIGVNLIFKNNGIIKAIVWLLFFSSLIGYAYYCQYTLNSMRPSAMECITIEKLAETKSGKLRVSLGGINLSMDSGETNLVDAECSIPNIKSRYDYKNDKESVSVDFETAKPFIYLNKPNATCKFYLSKDVLWDMDVEVGAAKGTLDCSDLQVRTMNIDCGAANFDLILGDKHGETDLEINAGASTFNVSVPKSAGIKLKVDAAFSNLDMCDLGLIKVNDYYISPNYDQAETKIDMEVDMGMGKLAIKGY